MTTLVKLEKNLCRCCHEEGYFVNLGLPFKYKDDENTYNQMLKYCFDIEIKPVEDPESDITYTICTQCIESLRSAAQFKKQVLFCEERFNEMLGQGDLMQIDEDTTVQVKEEKSDDEQFFNDNSVMISSDSDNGRVNDAPPRPKKIHKMATRKKKHFVKVVPKQPVFKKAAPKKRKPKKTEKKIKEVPQEVSEDNVEEKAEKEVKELTEEEKIVKEIRNERDERRRFRLQPSDYYIKETLYYCSHCNQTFSFKSMGQHVKREHYDFPQHVCPVCTEKFNSTAKFTQHKYEEHGIDDRHKCGLCDNRFNTLRALKSHKLNFHKLGRKIKCKQCNYCCHSVFNFRRHIVNHQARRDFTCSFCAKSFKRLHTLKYHEMIHTGERRKVCKICDQTFVQKASLNYHMKKNHPEVPF